MSELESAQLEELALHQFANFTLQNLLNKALNFRQEHVKASLTKVLDRLNEVIDSEENADPKQKTLRRKWLKLISSYRSGERSNYQSNRLG